MADRETIAAIIAAGMLSPVAYPDNRGNRVQRTEEQSDALHKPAVDHAIRLYRLVLEALPLAAHPEQPTGPLRLPPLPPQPDPPA